MSQIGNKKLSQKFLLVGFFVLVTLSSGPAMFSNVAHAATGTSTLTVNTQAANGTMITGLFVTLEDPTTLAVISWGFSPVSFTLQQGQTYLVVPSDYNNIIFDNWSDSGSNIREKSIAITSDALITAIYRDQSAIGPSSVTVKSSDDLGISLPGFYTILQQNGTTIKDGFTPQSFGVNNNQQYQTGVEDYGNYTFSRWGDNVTDRLHDITTGTGTTTNLSAIYKTVSTLHTNQIKFGLVAKDPLNNETKTQQQLVANSRYWIYGGDAPARNAPYDFFKNILGLNIGVQATSDGAWAGIYAASPRETATLFHSVVTTPVSTIPNQFYENAMYVQTSQAKINYVTCVAITSSAGTSWAVVYTGGNATQATQFHLLWADTSANQPLTRDCTIITNGNNYLKVYLDHNMVYTNSTLDLQMPGPFNVFLEPQSSYPGKLLNGTFLDYYVTAGEDVKVINLPASADTVYLVDSAGNALATAKVGGNTADLDVGAYHFPLAGTIKVYDSNNTLITSSPAIPDIYGGNEYSMNSSTLPQPPTALTASATSLSQIKLSWTTPVDNGGSTITGYEIDRSTDSQNTWSAIVQNTGTTSTSYNDTGLSSSLLYTYRVSAINSIGTSSPSNTATATTQVASPGITVYAHRIPASYWDPCFAATCSAGTGADAAMFVTLLDSSNNVVQTGFANEDGYTFLGLNSNSTYYVYPADCSSCHGSTHDVIFQYWGDDHSTVRPRAATVGANLHEWYSCTNNCAGGP